MDAAKQYRTERYVDDLDEKGFMKVGVEVRKSKMARKNWRPVNQWRRKLHDLSCRKNITRSGQAAD
jgi:hypothetical protein